MYSRRRLTISLSPFERLLHENLARLHGGDHVCAEAHGLTIFTQLDLCRTRRRLYCNAIQSVSQTKFSRSLEFHNKTLSTRGLVRHNSSAQVKKSKEPYVPSAREPDPCHSTQKFPEIGANLEDFKQRTVGIQQYLKTWREKDLETMAQTLRESSAFPIRPLEVVFDREDYLPDPDESDKNQELDNRAGLEQEQQDVSIPTFQLGDLVQHRRGTEDLLSIVIKKTDVGTVSYTERGTLLVAKPGKAEFWIPQFVKPKTIAQLSSAVKNLDITQGLKLARRSGFAELEDTLPRDLAKVPLAKIFNFRSSAQDLSFAVKKDLENTYETFAPKERGSAISATVAEIARRTFHGEGSGKPVSLAEVWAVSQYLQRLPVTGGKPNTPRQSFDSIRLLSKDALKAANQVRIWMREYRERSTRPASRSHQRLAPQLNPIDTFLSKARQTVLASRKTRSLGPRGFVGPSTIAAPASSDKAAPYVIINSCSLTSDEQMILHVFYTTLAEKAFNAPTLDQDLRSLVPMILRSTNLYNLESWWEMFAPQNMNAFAWTFLQELGVVPPWQNPSIYQTQYGISETLPLEGSKLPSIDAVNQIDWNNDSMQRFRVHWAGMPVFCVDSSTTTEIDDGFSLEQDSQDSTKTWIHVHVANPTAFIQPDSELAKAAAARETTTYLTGLRLPMLPDQVSRQHLSLANGRPCITFSGLIDEKGDLVKYNISHGTLNNVIYKTTEGVIDALNQTAQAVNESETLLAVGDRPDGLVDRSAHSKPQHFLSVNELAMLNRFMDMGVILRHRRERAGALRFPHDLGKFDDGWQLDVDVDFQDGFKSSLRPFGDTFQHYIGDPKITIKKICKDKRVKEVEDGVASMMLLAGEICGLWCQERGIPVAYRRTVKEAARPSEIDMPKLVETSQATTHSQTQDISRLFNSLGRIEVGPVAGAHVPLGLKVYTQCTSPLRRFGDALAHWQIEALIRQEGTGSATSVADLPFRTNYVRDLGRRSMVNTRLRRSLERKQREWLLMQAFHRAQLSGDDNKIADTYTLRIKVDAVTAPGGGKDGEYSGVIEGWDIRALVQDPKDLLTQTPAQAWSGLAVDQLWECKLLHVDAVAVPLTMVPLRFIGLAKD